MDNLDYHRDATPMTKYSISKGGNYLHGTEFAKRFKSSGVVSIPLNPGNLRSDLYRTQGLIAGAAINVIAYPVVYGAYTELFAGLSDNIRIEESGSWGESFIFYVFRWDVIVEGRPTC